MCQFYARDHPTRLHVCKICNIVGQICIHTELKCANCMQNHAANNKECNAKLAAKSAANSTANDSPSSSIETSYSLFPSSIQSVEMQY